MSKRLVEVILEVLDELGAAESHPIHRSRFNPIIESRWKKLGNPLDPSKDFGQAVSAELHRFSSDSSVWQKSKKKKQPDLFRMHGEGYWSIRDNAPHRGDITQIRLLGLLD